ncbi:hypothetical protein GH865_13235 [Rhodocyclus tenuis]|uniref:hypothetical protein n=1 Tax=Rhodocyclus gracilis TaxID=2929842 RepID=UPI001355B202|nr:hypothetical protein [Rhodocyclus gracilis]MRD74197.1 hypothetical protein [Rhodocyclus gracilis]
MENRIVETKMDAKMKQQQGRASFAFILSFGFWQFFPILALSNFSWLPKSVLGASMIIVFVTGMIFTILNKTSVVVGSRQNRTNQLLEQLLEEKKRENAMKSRRRRPTQKNEDAA